MLIYLAVVLGMALGWATDPLYWVVAAIALAIGWRWGLPTIVACEVVAVFVARQINIALLSSKYPDEDFSMTGLGIVAALLLGLVVGLVFSALAHVVKRRTQ